MCLACFAGAGSLLLLFSFFLSFFFFRQEIRPCLTDVVVPMNCTVSERIN